MNALKSLTFTFSGFTSYLRIVASEKNYVIATKITHFTLLSQIWTTESQVEQQYSFKYKNTSIQIMIGIEVVVGAQHRNVNLVLHESSKDEVICSCHDSIAITADPSRTGGTYTIQTEP